MSNSAKKGCLYGCLAIAGLGILGIGATVIVLIIFWDDIQSHSQEVNARTETESREISNNLFTIQQNLSKLTPITQEKACPTGLTEEVFAQFPTSIAQLSQYTPQGFIKVPIPLNEWYRSNAITKLSRNMEKGSSAKQWNRSEVEDAIRDIRDHSHIAVYIPRLQEWPESRDGTAFETGVYDGWVVLVDLLSLQPTCHGHFFVMSSESVLSHSGSTSLQLAAEEDFERNFWKQAEQTISRIRIGQVQPVGGVGLEGVSSSPRIPPSIETGAPITLGGTVGGIIRENHRIRYPFSLTTAHTVNIYVDGQEFDPTVALLNGDGTQIGFDDDGGNDLDSSLTLALQPGPYFIEVGGFSDLSGTFTLTVR